ncbi:hypothetical protein CVS40_4828 [Lucilia cuprina]|nr:hypothetical protein CVS40_4828 [Lucilia cuprina]
MNIFSLHSRRIDLENTLKSNQIGIAFLQETHLNSKHKIFLEEYCTIRDDNTVGIGVIFKEKYSFRRINIDGVLFQNFFVEITIIINGTSKRLIFGSRGDLNSRNIAWGDNLNNLNANTLFNWLQDFSAKYIKNF